VTSNQVAVGAAHTFPFMARLPTVQVNPSLILFAKIGCLASAHLSAASPKHGLIAANIRA
jgi:hypothetical protein